MDIGTFRRIVTAFADEAIDVDLGKGRLVAQIRDELVEVTVLSREGTVWIREDEEEYSAYSWILKRLARLELLADRILAQIPEERFYVDPQGSLLRDIAEAPESGSQRITNAADGILEALKEGLAGVTQVLYLTSDAGEGKTTLINHVSRELARRYKNRECNWLLVPISLSGRPFMALDDIVVAELTNRFRFNLYYDAFTELVRLNAVVPALDGFEEVFLETDSGEAVSALGNLINQLGGSGRVLIAARKAYFEIRSFASQARIFDTIGEDAGASFERLSLRRWSKRNFYSYARKRGIDTPEVIHKQIAKRLQDSDHPLLTRAVLVAKLMDVALEGDINELLKSLSRDPEDYFYQFVGALIEREANTKWIDRSLRGDAASPLLSIEEHLSLLSQIAREMWINRTDALRSDYIELIADVFSAENQKSAAIAHQVQERLHQHSLLVTRGSSTKKLAFDHEDFRQFFLGQALGAELLKSDSISLGTFLRTAPLPLRTVDAAISFAARKNADFQKVLESVTSIGMTALDTSYEKENAGLVTVRLLEKTEGARKLVRGLAFPPSALSSRTIRNVEFLDCRFQATYLGPTQNWNVEFRDCNFDRIELNSYDNLEGVRFIDCEIASIFLADKELAIFGPEQIRRILSNATGKVDSDSERVVSLDDCIDDATRIAEQALRAFMRATHLNENVFRQRLGQNANEFFDRILPDLLEGGVLEEIEYRGSGTQRRFKLSVPMRNIEPAIRTAKDLRSFIILLKGSRP
ncbi:hypothetical protein [Elongatibacter sediminis]|uniref:NACHT domain-containing protein n=1 Tax=Elongatibacter sediminis TaxID=3119006 RepID=A0AAW9R7Q8_9GAMM